MKTISKDLNSIVIWKSNEKEFGEFLSSIPDMPKFIHLYGNETMKNVIRRGDINIFKMFFRYVDPNSMLSFEYQTGMPRARFTAYCYKSILYHAISERKPKIAEFLARDERVDISKGFGDVTPLQNAENISKCGEGMENVIAILAARTAEQHRKLADTIERKASDYADIKTFSP